MMFGSQNGLDLNSEALLNVKGSCFWGNVGIENIVVETLRGHVLRDEVYKSRKSAKHIKVKNISHKLIDAHIRSLATGALSKNSKLIGYLVIKENTWTEHFYDCSLCADQEVTVLCCDYKRWRRGIDFDLVLTFIEQLRCTWKR